MNKDKITSTTLVYGLIGDPVEHSISPIMQNVAFQISGIKAVYLPFRVKKENLKQAIAGIKALGIQGLNVTIPHKVAVVGMLDEIDPLAAKIGSVNTIVNSNRVLCGYNTDANGFLRLLQNTGITSVGKSIALLGAGGAARAIAFCLVEKVSRLMIINRHLEKAEKLAEQLSSQVVSAIGLHDPNMRSLLSEASVVINATSLGTWPKKNESPLPDGVFHSGQTVIDIIYNPIKTQLLKDAEVKGAKTINGIEMLVCQGALSWELWTGKSAPIAAMRTAVRQALDNP